MTSNFDYLCLGEMTILGKGFSFFGEVYVYYNTPTQWSFGFCEGVLTDADGDRFRGRWIEGRPDFDRIKEAFMEDERLTEVAAACVKRRLNIFREKADG